MVFAEVLELAGAPSSWVILAIAILGVYHLRSGIGFLSRVSTVVQVLAFVAVILVAAAAGFIPGVDLSIALDPFMAMLDGIVRFLGALVGGLV